MSKRKPMTRSKLKKKMDNLAKEIAKIRDDYTCQHCGKKVEGSNCHGSHVVPVSAGDKLRWDLQNIKALCYHCHLNWWHKNPIEASEWFGARFPDRKKYLEENRGVVNYKMSDLENIYNELKERKKELKNG